MRFITFRYKAFDKSNMLGQMFRIECKADMRLLKLGKAKTEDFQNSIYEPWHEIFNNMVCATSKGSDKPAHTRRLIRAFASRLNIL